MCVKLRLPRENRVERARHDLNEHDIAMLEAEARHADSIQNIETHLFGHGLSHVSEHLREKVIDSVVGVLSTAYRRGVGGNPLSKDDLADYRKLLSDAFRHSNTPLPKRRRFRAAVTGKIAQHLDYGQLFAQAQANAYQLRRARH